MSIVIKPALANGIPTVKLSDNIAKAVGDSATIAHYKKLSAYGTNYNKDCIY